MSFFGQQNNQQQGTGFKGFGSTSNNNTSGGFGQQPATSGGGLFGSTTNTSGNAFGGFGSGGTSGGFGSSSNTTPFGQNRPSGFGSTTSTAGGGLFGSGTATAGTSGGFGGFGGSNNNNNASGGGLFGSGSGSKPSFGASNTAGGGGGLFGGGNTSGGFGSSNNQSTGLFGQPNSTALSTNVGECQGTGSTPFSAFTEKEGPTSATNHFQSITFLAPYKNFSFEELRLADYNQGRRFGNASGHAGAFGTTNFGSGFGSGTSTGGFGQQSNTGSGLFGSSTTSAPFGQAQSATSGGFGSSSGGGLFGGSKPGGGGGGLFGSSNNASSAPSSGGLFGTSGGNTGGFGSGGGFGGGGGGFGQNNNTQNQQSKPFSFGSTTSTAGTGGFGSNSGFGSTNNTNTGGLFGNPQATNTSNPFGGTQQQQPAQNSNPFGGFGQSNTQTNAGTGFGNNNTANTGGGLFGSTQPATNTGGGLFGNTSNNQQQGSSGLFGNTSNNNQQSGGLFGSKPAGTGGGLFGNTNTNTTNTGGGLFGSSNFGNTNNNQNQQNQGSSLFGNTGNQQKPGGLFGGAIGNTGSSLFGNSTNNQPTGGLFGSQSQQPQQQQTSSLFGNSNTNAGSSLFGGSQQQQPNQQNAFQQPQTFQTSILDPNAFGSPSIFGGLPPPPQVSGPIATPISAKKQIKKSTIIPSYRSSPNVASRYQTPPRRAGFGFSYSTYGTPGSASSNVSTPGGFTSSLYSSVGRGLGKSLSTSNLRRNFDEADSILTPGAFSAGSSRYGGSSNMKRLTIDRSLRTDLFSGARETPPALPSPEKERQPSILKKKVSFDASTVGGNGGQQATPNGVNENEQQNHPTAEQQGFLRSPRTPGRAKSTTPLTAQPEVEQVRGNELAIVHEDASPELVPTNSRAPAAPRSHEDQKPGHYWMKPPKEELQKLSKEQRTRVQSFSVGREGCGFVEFDVPVDLTLTKNLEDIYENIVHIELRSITVYPDQLKKPAQGKGLNVPSTLHLENSWPRQKDKKTPLYETSGPRFQKHIDRLRKVTGTEFVRYEKETGTWVFKVPHFTTYGFDYDDDASIVSEGDKLQSSILSEAPPTPTPKARGLKSGQMTTTNDSTERSVALVPMQPTEITPTQESSLISSPNDTFQFRKKKFLPGSFDEEGMIDDDEEQDIDMEEAPHENQSFLDDRLVLPSEDDEDEPSEVHAVNQIDEGSLVVRSNTSDEEADDMELEMAGAFPEELETAKSMITPGKFALNFSGDWAEELQRSISPRKQDRQVLRESWANVEGRRDFDEEATPGKKTEGTTGKGSTMMTHMDLMDSLWGQEQLKRSGQGKKPAKANGIKLPLSKNFGTREDDSHIPEQIRLLHDNYKPRWGPKSLLMYSIPGKSKRHPPTQTDDFVQPLKSVITSEGGDIRFAKIGAASRIALDSLNLQRAHSKVVVNNGVPMMQTQQTPFADFAAAVGSGYPYEETVWTLASILFDDQDSVAHGVPASQAAAYDYRIRKDRLIELWSRLCAPAAAKGVKEAKTYEERAFQHLSANQIFEACDELAQGKDYHLATLISQTGDGDQVVHDDMESQINTWRDLNSLSEMTEPIRAIYALTAGKTCKAEGKKGPPEDRAATFALSTRFSLDWKRAFGLRLYYSILSTEAIEVAVKNFAEDLEKGEEPAKPTRTVMNPDGTTQEADGEDLLWGLLKLYAASKEWVPFPMLANMLSRQSLSSRDNLNTLLSFQLYHALSLRFPKTADDFVADSLAIDFAEQLECTGEWIWSLFATLHITNAAQRQRAIQALLSFHINEFEVDNDDQRFQALIEECQIPKAWIWRAKAQAARTITQNHIEEAKYLIKADELQEAHEVLRHVVGPRCVIAEEWTILGDLLVGFEEGKENINDWGLGGQVYEDYLALIRNRITGNAKVALLGRLMDTLPNLAKPKSKQTKSTRPQGTNLSSQGFEEMVAVKEMSAKVAKEIMTMDDGPWRKQVDAQQTKLLNLPMAKEEYFKGTMELAERYYKAVLGGS